MLYLYNMCKKCLISSLVALAALVSGCGSGTDGGERDPETLPDLLYAVPSDALAVSCAGRSGDAIALLDSTDRLRTLDLGAFRSAPAVLSMSYNGSLVPSLTIGTGQKDSSASVTSALREARRRGIYSAYFAPDASEGRQGFLAFTVSESQMTALKRHINSGSSVLDAPGFPQAAALTSGDDFTVIRNSGAGNLMPRGFLGGLFPRRSLASFLHKAADWTVLVPEGGGEYRVRTAQGDSDSYFVNVLSSLPTGRSRLGEVLPDSVDFAMSLPVQGAAFREAYERYVDASVRMTAYTRRLSALKTASGKDPLKWEKELDVTEVALVRWDGKTAVLLRPGKTLAGAGVEDNPYWGFIPALYGDAFSLADDSCRGVVCGWYAIGSREAVGELVRREEIRKDSGWPGRGCRFVIYNAGRFLAWDKKGMKLWNSSL